MDYITYGSEENGNQSRGVIVYEDKSDMSKAAGRMEYMSKHRSPLLPVQEKLAKVTEQHSEGVMLSAPDSTMILTNMLKFSGAKKCIDVGVFTGYSALSWALSIPEDGKVVALDVSEEDASIGKPFWKEAGVEHKIDLRIAPANKSLQEMLDSGEGGSYDFMYIDADKEGYDTYYELGLKLLRAGGIIAIDNVS
ncbi:hypothetical protein EB796_008479 [Bugula neritina]|uniref:COMTD1 n=1 Tax=Bugula neritina TaxID=10212 RepID=A0A7J7K4R8_BUGNE|nr:hypothetical protein EB796_008479 [Bugula neritina]